MLNHVVIMGRFVRDPELKCTPSGNSVVSFTIAVDRGYKTKNENNGTDFIPCVAWKGTAEFVSKYFEKGRMAAVEGRIQSRKYTNSSGENRTVVEIVANSVYFADSKREHTQEKDYLQSYESQQQEFIPVDTLDSDDDLPF